MLMFTIASRLTNQNLIQCYPKQPKERLVQVQWALTTKVLANSDWYQVAWRQPLLLLNYFLQSSSDLIPLTAEAILQPSSPPTMECLIIHLVAPPPTWIPLVVDIQCLFRQWVVPTEMSQKYSLFVGMIVPWTSYTMMLKYIRPLRYTICICFYSHGGIL